MLELDARYRSSWDVRSIAHVVGVGRTTVARILREHRGQRPTPRRPSHNRRTRFLRRDVMWSSDYVVLPDERKLLKTMDEMSSFRLGWDIECSENAGGLVRHAEACISRMGRAPLVWKYDHGSAFMSDQFQGLLARHQIIGYAIPPRAPWANGRTERDNREVRNWLIPAEAVDLKGAALERDIDDGLLMLNYVKPRAMLGYRTSAKTYFEAEGVSDVDRQFLNASIEKMLESDTLQRSIERCLRKAVRQLLEKMRLYEEWDEAKTVNRLEPAFVSV